jgi:transposase
MRFDLTDEEWALLDPLMPERRKGASVDDRKIMNATHRMPW